MIAFLVSIIVTLLAAIVMAIWQQSEAFKRGFELGVSEGVKRFSDALCARLDAGVQEAAPEAVYPEGHCDHGVSMLEHCVECCGSSVPVIFKAGGNERV